MDKLEVVSTHYQRAKDKLLDLIYQHYDIDSNTMIVTNSDGGKGYSPKVFKELADAFNPKKHFHFWDAFHVNQALKRNLSSFPSGLTNKAFKAIKNRDKSGLKTVLDTAESFIESDEKLEAFQRFSRQLMKNFKFTDKPESFGLSSNGIGIMESQHRKITYRMKNRGMYWSKKGANAMSQTILLSHTGELRDLFFGEWRSHFDTMKDQEKNTPGLPCHDENKNYTLPQLKRTNVKKKWGNHMIEERD